MIFREAGKAEAAEIAHFLRGHLDRAMFALSNLAHHGMGRAGRYQMRFWLKRTDSTIKAAVGLSAAGMLLPVLPGVGRHEMADLRAALAGEWIAGIIGVPDWARSLRVALGLPQTAIEHAVEEPGFALDLADLIVPDAQGLTLCRPGDRDRALLILWRAAYRGEVMGTPPDRCEAEAAEDIDHNLAHDSHRILLKDGVPVATTGFNAILPEAVQIGGVYTPPELRGRGYARAAVALHLTEARAAGIPRAVLFAANAPAARAYQAIGFQPSDRALMLFFRDGTSVRA